MEATGVYWKPVWHVLADGDFALVLANAAHVKNVPGRKTDVADATWLAELLAHGLVRASFVPDAPTQALRALLRTHCDGVDAPRRHLRAKVAVLTDHQRRRPWERLARSAWTSRSGFSRPMARMRPGGWCSASACSRAKLLEFFAAQPPCVVAMEACGGAHHWARELGKLGHTVRLIPPAYVKPFVKRQKNDAADAEAICEAAQRPTMRFVPVKSEEQQANSVVFRARDLLVRQRTQCINALRGHLAEYGHVVPQGPAHVDSLVALVEDQRPPCRRARARS